MVDTTSDSPIEIPKKAFADFKFSPILLEGILRNGFENCTPIQAQAFGPILKGADVAGLAQTGTGKTAAFLLPLMERITRSLHNDIESQDSILPFPDWKNRNFVLVLVPTRELAEQVIDNIEKLKGETGLRGVAVYGGVAYQKQIQGLKEGVEFVVATPGRLIDLYKENVVDLKQVRAIVFDEADRMFDMGFKDDMKFILQRVPKERQFLVFSATLNLEVLNTAYQFGAQPVEINISRDEARAENVKDYIFHVGNNDKPAYLLSVLKRENPKQAIIFSNFKMNIERVAQFLQKNGYAALGISSMLSQAQRSRVMEQFKSQSSQNILVATDVAARGLDVKGVDLVINFELPEDAENYVHRIGRTGRAGAEGKAFSLVSDLDVESLSRIENFLKKKIDVEWVEDTELVKEYAPFPHRTDKVYSGNRDKREKSNGRGGGRDDRRPRSGSDRGPREERPREKAEGVPATGGVIIQKRKTPPAGEASTPHQHRDRTSGRHRDQKNALASAPTRSAEATKAGRSIKPRSNNKHVPAGKGPFIIKPKKKSLSQKVTTFFKSLFK